MLEAYLRQMMPAAQAARLVASHDDALHALASVPCTADIGSHLVAGVDVVAGDPRSVDRARHPVTLDTPSGGERTRLPGRRAGEPRPQAAMRDSWASCDGFDPALYRCEHPAGYCDPAASPGSHATSIYVRKTELIARLSDLASEAGYEATPNRADLPFIEPGHLTGGDSELWGRAAREWRMHGRLAEQVLMMSALAMRPAIHHRETATLLDDVWVLRGYYDDMGASETPVDPRTVSELACVWRRRAAASGLAIAFWNRLRRASMTLECGPRRDVTRLVDMDDRTAVRFLSFDTCVPFLIRPEVACQDMTDSTLSQVLGGTGDVVDDVRSGEWANGLLVSLGPSMLEPGRGWMPSVLADVDVVYVDCLTRRRYVPLAQMALCVPVWQALNGRHMLIERAALQEASPDWSWPDEMVSLAVNEIQDVAGRGSFDLARRSACGLLDGETFARLANDPVCHALLDAERFDTPLVLTLLGYLFSRCTCAAGRVCRLHAPRSPMCSDAAGAYALLSRRLGLGSSLMAMNAWLSAVIFLKRRSTFRAMAYGVHAQAGSPRGDQAR